MQRTSKNSPTPYAKGPCVQPTPAIFKAYDIRGIVPSTLNEEVALGLGRAFGTAARAEGQTTVAVGRDGRLSGPAISGALIQGLVEAGIEVIDVGLVTTPLLYFAASTLCASGIQVTGSHNPRDYNGFKMVLNGRAIYGEEIQQLRRTMEQETWQLLPGGSVRHVDVLPAYRERIVGDVKLARPIKIVVDCGNGIAGASAPDIFRALGCEVIELFSIGKVLTRQQHPIQEITVAGELHGLEGPVGAVVAVFGSVVVGIEDAGISLGAQQDQGIGQGFEPISDG